MDLRVKKTKQSIREAFLALRVKKPLEKISVKELCEKAVINKTTFYLHYQSIYDLSEAIEDELISECLSNISDEDMLDPGKTVREFYRAFSEHGELFRVLFPDDRIVYPARKANEFMKQRIFAAHPQLKSDSEFGLRYTAIMYGCFFAYLENKDSDVELTIARLARLADESIIPHSAK